MSAARLARPEIRTLRPYRAASQVDGAVRLNANEVPAAGTSAFRRPLNRYPEVRPTTLRKMLAERFSCDPAGLFVTRGSSEAIDLLIRAFCRPGIDNILTVAPTFSMYGHYAQIQNAKLIEVTTTEEQGFAATAEEILRQCRETTRLIFLCSPNNPTGRTIAEATLTEVLRARRGRSLVVVDEAYVEFADTPTTARLLPEHDNLVVLRTLSKAGGFAGVRCGAAIGATDVIDILDAIQAPYALATPVVECIEQELRADSADSRRSRIGTIVAERTRVAGALSKLTCVERVFPSAANFLLVKFRSAGEIVEHCRRRNILLRDFSNTLPGCVRISIGSDSENRLLLVVLRRYDRGHSQ